MRKRHYTFLPLTLAFLIAVQSVTIAKVALPLMSIERDSYGGIICTSHSKSADMPYKQQHFPDCCINGCIFSLTLDNPVPENIFLRSATGKGKALAIVLAVSLRSFQSSFVYDARSPPPATIFV